MLPVSVSQNVTLKRGACLAVIMVAIVATVMGARLFSDTFVGANGTRPKNLEPAGGEDRAFWVLANSELASGNATKLTAAGGVSYAIVSNPDANQWNNYYIQVEFWNPEPVGGTLLVGRWRDNRNFYEGGVFSDGGRRYMKIDRVANGQRLTLVRQDSGPGFDIPKIEGMPNREGRHVLRMAFNGDEIVLSLGGKQTIRVRDGEFKTGRAGLGAKDTSINFDNLIVDSEVTVATASPVPGAAPLTAATAAGQVGGAERWQVKIAENLAREAASQLQRNLQVDGYAPIDMVDVNGQFTVLVGALSTRKDAEDLMKDLQTNGGYQPMGVQQAGQKPAAAKITTAEAGKVYRVMVSEFNEQGVADQAREALLQDDYAGVEVMSDAGRYRVLIGAFPTEEGASKLFEQLKRDGYSLAKIVSTAETAAPTARDTTKGTPEPLVIPDQFKPLIKTSQDEAKVLAIAKQMQNVERGTATSDEIIELRNELKRLQGDLKQVVTAVTNVTSSEQQKRETDKKVRGLYSEFNNAMAAKDWAKAEQKLAQVREIAPTEAALDYRTDLLSRMREGRGAMVSAEKEKENKERVQTLLAEARAAEAQKQYDKARGKYYEVVGIDSQNAEAKTKAEEMTRQLEASQRAVAPADGASGGSNKMLYLAIGGVVLALAIFGFVLMKIMRRERELIRHVQELESHTGEGIVPANEAATPVAQKPAPAPAPAKPKKGKPAVAAAAGTALFGADLVGSAFSTPHAEEADGEAKGPLAVPLPEPEPLPEPVMKSAGRGQADVVMIHGVTETEQPASEIDMPPPSPVGETLKLDGLDIPMGGADELPPLPEEMPIPGVSTAVPELDLDAFLQPAGNEPPSASAPAAGEELVIRMPELPSLDIPGTPDDLMDSILGTATAPAAPSPQRPATPVEIPMPPVPPAAKPVPEPPAAAEAPVPPPAAVPVPEPKAATGVTAAADGVFYDQSFDDEQPGEQPKGWRGEYDYANLQVDSSSPVSGSGNCLRFEKKSGAGSANYACHFPKATGHIIVEFDLRCDDKNKYLLGFYIEKDEDFKQSVHTIVHRIDSKSQPSLRVQGEPIPYDFGSWRHLKYDINLLVGVVNAYVDDQQIVKDGKLPANPPYLNTLSIRDNLATTGVLLLDNIRIRKA